MTEAAEAISYDQFAQVEMRVGRVIRVEEFPRARKPAYKLWIDFGEYGIKKSSAQVTTLYSMEQMEGRLVVAVTNFAPRQVADFMSEVLVMGVPGAGGEVVLLQPDRDVPLGGRVY